VWAYGEGDNDVLVGTHFAGGNDYLDGGSGDDYLYSYINNARDTVVGGTGNDKGTFDLGLDSVSGVETQANG
jgi:Ca2+-binding RTX toxin-like protein